MIKTCVAVTLALAIPTCRPAMHASANDRLRCHQKPFPVNVHVPRQTPGKEHA